MPLCVLRGLGDQKRRRRAEIYRVLIARNRVVGHNYVRRLESGGLFAVYDRNKEVRETRERAQSPFLGPTTSTWTWTKRKKKTSVILSRDTKSSRSCTNKVAQSSFLFLKKIGIVTML